MESILSIKEPSQGDRKVMTNRSSPNPAAMRRTTIMPLIAQLTVSYTVAGDSSVMLWSIFNFSESFCLLIVLSFDEG
jgi:hypothetical protein